MLYQSASSGYSLGLLFRTLRNGVPGSVTELVGDESTDGRVNSASLGLDAHGHSTIIYTRGTYPDTDFVWLGQVPAVP